MRLRNAKICFNDDEITDRPHCPVCGKVVTWHLATWLNRRPENISKDVEETVKYVNASYVKRIS